MQYHQTNDSVPQRQERFARRVAVDLFCRYARLLAHLLRRMDWSALCFADKRRLDRALARLQSDLTLTRAITGETPTDRRRQDG